MCLNPNTVFRKELTTSTTEPQMLHYAISSYCRSSIRQIHMHIFYSYSCTVKKIHKSVHKSSVSDSYILLLFYLNVLFSCQICMRVCTSFLKNTTNSSCLRAHLANKFWFWFTHMKMFLYIYTMFFKCFYWYQTQNPFESLQDVAGHPKRTYSAKWNDLHIYSEHYIWPLWNRWQSGKEEKQHGSNGDNL